MGSSRENHYDKFIYQKWVSKLHLTCPICEAEIQQEVSVPEPDYTGEKSGDMVSEGEVEIHCSGCGNHLIGNAWSGPAQCDIQLIEYPDTQIWCDAPGYDRPPEDWFEDWPIPEDPVAIYRSNVAEMRVLIEKYAQDDGASLMNRMMFAQILTFLEAYLCDALISTLRLYPGRLAEFAAKDASISQMNFQASDVLRDPNHVKKLLENNLKSRLYHNFGRPRSGEKKAKPEGVALWYVQAFGFKLTPSDEHLERLRNYAALRHDCVHRNGKTKEDVQLENFDRVYLLEFLLLANQVVTHIQESLDSVTEIEDLPF